MKKEFGFEVAPREPKGIYERISDIVRNSLAKEYKGREGEVEEILRSMKSEKMNEWNRKALLGSSVDPEKQDKIWAREYGEEIRQKLAEKQDTVGA